jgi:16S rRNA (guanine966-N2)-methyltransferase
MPWVPDAGRVIEGVAAGRRLDAPGPLTRPLADRVKQALFGLIEGALAEPWAGPMLDLFAGSGAAGIEALSRGAPRAVFVERETTAARTIERNLERCGLMGGRIVRRDALGWLEAGAAVAGEGPFRVTVIDPPYDRPGDLVAALVLVSDARAGWLADDACVVAKHFWRDAPGGSVGGLTLTRLRRFGETALSVYRLRPAPDREGA